MPIRIGINGFGRIGRLVYRIAAEDPNLEIVAVNDLVPADNLAYLLKYDTMHGRFRLNGKLAEVSATETSFTVNARTTKTTAEKDPARLPWKDLGVHYVLESTGLFTDFEKASLHVAAGAKRVIISAPTKSEPAQVPTLCYKVNHEQYDPSRHTVISNASCTTNCLAPIAKVIEDNFGLAEGLMTTVHAATATQPTQDGPSKKDWRGGRNAYQNIIPASTGAAKAVTLCLPSLKGKLTGMSFRVPTADVSAVDLTFRTSKPTSLAQINAAMKAAAEGSMRGVLAYTEEEVVSSDFIGDRHSSVYDAKAGIELNAQFFKIVSWYDNEAGYAARCVDMIRMLAAKDGIA
ncbi:MAG: type I glyceraldehyde-3-phosphate dehydrogenase [Phycisphaeraceae bacterium]|nr:type I glyceraldehyde-3-phosphate dehydrogenase [Phycisphaeraceae bacterium]MCW5753101.1 type I glyceraldehyde-3-phosphate dehydrogenase [Phycisphaeraceae bacterium]